MKRISRFVRVWCLVVPAFLVSTISSEAVSISAAQDATAKVTKGTPAKPDADKQQREKDEEYFELLRLFADAFDQIERNYVKEVSRRELMEAAVRGALSKLDPYSSYISPEELDRFRSGVESEFGGIGIQVTSEDGLLKVISPIVGSPAYRAGVLAGDHIIKIEGKGTKGITLDEAVKKLKGKVGTDVSFTIYHPHDKSTNEVTVTREIVKVKTVLGMQRRDDDSWDFMLDPERKIGYIRVSAFSRNTVAELTDALDQLKAQAVRAVVLDLRYNPGGLLSGAIEMSDLFLSKGRIVSTEGRNTIDRVWDAKKDGTYDGFPMVVLVNQYSASASEIVAAALQDNDRAVVIGQRTWGKGSVQNIIELESGRSALKLTTAGYQRPNGNNIHRFPGAKEQEEWGVAPNDGYEVEMTLEDARRLNEHQRRIMLVKNKANGNGEQTETPEPPYIDPQLAKAIEHLKSELSGKDAPETEKEEASEPVTDQARGRPKAARPSSEAA